MRGVVVPEGLVSYPSCVCASPRTWYLSLVAPPFGSTCRPLAFRFFGDQFGLVFPHQVKVIGITRAIPIANETIQAAGSR